MIDDDSTDGSVDFLIGIEEQHPEVRVIFRDSRLGIGSAHLLGLAEAKKSNFEFLLTMDADLTHLVSDAKRVIEAIDESDLVIGSRYLGRADIHGWSKLRIFLTRFGHRITTKFFFSDIDMSSGLRAYRLENLPLDILIKNCPLSYEFFFISALVYLKENLRVDEIRVTLKRRGAGQSKMSFHLVLKGATQLCLYALRIKRIRKPLL